MINHLQDSLNILSKTTWKRINNTARVYSSYRKGKFTGRAEIQGFPISMSIEPTTSCNLRCPECPSGLRAFTRPTGMLDPTLFIKVIDEIYSTLTWLTFYFQGEPYLHKSFLDMVSYASGLGIYTATSTNAHYLSDGISKATVESGLDRLIISIDGTTQETYASYRKGGDLNKVIEGTKNILSWRKALKSKTPYIIFQFLVVKPNEHQVDEIHQLARTLGVDQVNIKTAQIYDFEHGSDLIPVNNKFSRYKKNPDNTFSIKNDMLNHCWKMWSSCVLTWDGKVVPCCFDKDAQYVLGEINNHSFKSVWLGEPYQTFRSALLSSRSEIEICKNCTEGTNVFA